MMEGQEVPKQKRRSSEEIRRLVVEFEASGLRVAEFCRNHGLAQSTLQRALKRRHLEEGQAQAGVERRQTQSNRLIAVELARRDQDGNSRSSCALKIALSKGRRIEVGPHFDADTLERLVKLLERW
jgi:transposase-like protein